MKIHGLRWKKAYEAAVFITPKEYRKQEKDWLVQLSKKVRKSTEDLK